MIWAICGHGQKQIQYFIWSQYSRQSRNFRQSLYNLFPINYPRLFLSLSPSGPIIRRHLVAPEPRLADFFLVFSKLVSPFPQIIYGQCRCLLCVACYIVPPLAACRIMPPLKPENLKGKKVCWIKLCRMHLCLPGGARLCLPDFPL